MTDASKLSFTDLEDDIADLAILADIAMRELEELRGFLELGRKAGCLKEQRSKSLEPSEEHVNYCVLNVSFMAANLKKKYQAVVDAL